MNDITFLKSFVTHLSLMLLNFDSLTFLWLKINDSHRQKLTKGISDFLNE